MHGNGTDRDEDTVALQVGETELDRDIWPRERWMDKREVDGDGTNRDEDAMTQRSWTGSRLW